MQRSQLVASSVRPAPHVPSPLPAVESVTVAGTALMAVALRRALEGARIQLALTHLEAGAGGGE